MKAIWYRFVCLLLVLAAHVAAQESMPQFSLRSLSTVGAYEVGKSFMIAAQGDIPAPWHAYYRNPGTVGEAMTATLQAPVGFSVEGPFWQVPTRHVADIGTAYVYEKPLVIWRITPQADAPENARFTVRAEAQLCSDSGCLPPQAAVASLDMQRGEPAPDPAWSALEQQVETLGDKPLQEVRAHRVPGGVVLRFKRAESTPPSGAYFFSDDNSIAPAAEQAFRCADDACELTLQANDGKDHMYPAPADKSLRRLEGMLSFADGSHARISVPVEAPSGAPAGLWEAVVSLFLGGLLLNLMPCVFPVLGLKIMSFVSLGGGSRGRVVGHSIIFAVGILVSFWVLGLLLVALSNADMLAHASWHEWPGILWGDEGASDRTWARWMENEWVVYGILLLLLALGLSMYGVFEIGARATGIGSDLQQRGGYAGSFFQGCLITLVATPCSAPFLGSAITVAMSFPAVWMLVALTGMAIGLALPYLLLSAFPWLVHMLPRPGAWMESLKQGLSFLLFAAAAWMLDVYLSFMDAGSRSGNTLWVLISLVVFCAAFWVYGRWCALYRSKLSRWVGFLAALLLLALGVWGSMPRSQSDDSAPEWLVWSPEAMAEALEEGSPVFVDFTAKWCVTCQSNKKFAYTDAVYKAFAERDVVLMRADKTRPSPAIDAELRRLHRSAVPTNALYIPGTQPIVTSELLTPGYLLAFIAEHLPLSTEAEEDY